MIVPRRMRIEPQEVRRKMADAKTGYRDEYEAARAELQKLTAVLCAFDEMLTRVVELKLTAEGEGELAVILRDIKATLKKQTQSHEAALAQCAEVVRKADEMAIR